MRRAALLLWCACGPQAALYVTIEAPLKVPEQCDAVRVVANERGTQLYDQRFELDSGFPQTLTLTPTARDMIGGDVTVTVTAFKGTARSTAWSEGSAVATLAAGALTPVTVRLCDCP